MIREKVIRLIFGCVLLSLPISCSFSSNKEKESDFKGLFPNVDMNTQIQFWDITDTYKLGDCPFLEVENLSSNKMIFPSDYGIRIFTYVEGEWFEIENTMQYVPPGNPQISPKGSDSPGVMSIALCPKLDTQEESIEIRVVITNMVSEDTPDIGQVGAFVDVTFNP